MYNPQKINLPDLVERRVKLTRNGENACKGFLRRAWVVNTTACFEIIGAEEKQGSKWVRCDDIDWRVSTKDMVVADRTDCTSIERAGYYSMEVYFPGRWRE